MHPGLLSIFFFNFARFESSWEVLQCSCSLKWREAIDLDPSPSCASAASIYTAPHTHTTSPFLQTHHHPPAHSPFLHCIPSSSPHLAAILCIFIASLAHSSCCSSACVSLCSSISSNPETEKELILFLWETYCAPLSCPSLRLSATSRKTFAACNAVPIRKSKPNPQKITKKKSPLHPNSKKSCEAKRKLVGWRHPHWFLSTKSRKASGSCKFRHYLCLTRPAEKTKKSSGRKKIQHESLVAVAESISSRGPAILLEPLS